MKAIILAAGLGTRLRPITNDVPKCMVPVNGQPIIDKQIDNITENGIPQSDIVVVGGYKGDILTEHIKELYPDVKVIDNSRYNETNNMYSLYLAMKEIGENDFLLMNADVYFDSNIITGLMEKCDAPNAIASDKSQYLEESMKICVSEEGNITHISKQISEQDHFAVSIDVYKISQKASKALFNVIKDFIEVRKDENSWTEVALDSLFKSEIFKPYIIEGRWFEIDNHEDLKAAETLFES